MFPVDHDKQDGTPFAPVTLPGWGQGNMAITQQKPALYTVPPEETKGWNPPIRPNKKEEETQTSMPFVPGMSNIQEKKLSSKINWANPSPFEKFSFGAPKQQEAQNSYVIDQTSNYPDFTTQKRRRQPNLVSEDKQEPTTQRPQTPQVGFYQNNAQTMLAQQGVSVPETCVIHNQSSLEPNLFNMAGSYLQIFTSIPVTCSGQIVAWQFVRFSRDPEAAFYASVWRRVNRRRIEYELVGANRIIGGRDRYRKWKTYVVPKEERIDVKEGQHLGIFYDNVDIDSSRMVVPFMDWHTPNASSLVEAGVAKNIDMREFEEIKMVSNGLIRVTFDHGFERWRLPALVAYILRKLEIQIKRFRLHSFKYLF